MSITDELREWLKSLYTPNSATLKDEGERIADRIDAEHERKVADTRNDALYNANESDMAERGWVRGPLDADGEMWHSGDMSDSNWGVIEGIAYENGRWLISGHDMSAPWVPADSIRHYHAPTVEDVLREFANEVYADADNDIRDRDFLCAKYAKRLKLAEGEGE